MTVIDMAVCPKCGRVRQPGEDACARCGLLVARWAGFVTDVSSDPVVDAAWAALLADWQDEQAHKRFLEVAGAAGALDLAAARYRTVIDDPERASRAADGMSCASSLAEARVSQEAAAGRIHGQTNTVMRWMIVLVVIFGLGVAWGVFSLVRR